MSIPALARQKFSVVSEGPVTWSLAEGSAAGVIAADGTYTAPRTPGTYHVIARTPAGSASATVTVIDRTVTISVTPAQAQVATGEALQLRAEVRGADDREVLWTASKGSIDANGLYLAPGEPGTFEVQATSHADPTRSAVAVLSVTAHVVTVAVDPPVAALAPSARTHFNAGVAGASDTAVAWSVLEGSAGGFVDAAGYYTAPPAPGTFHVVATSRADPSQYGVAEVRVANGVAVLLAPAAVKVIAGGQQQFAAAVSGADGRVSWQVVEGQSGGSIDASGLYLAPRTPGTYHVRAASLADPARAATAQVTVVPATVSIFISPLEITVGPGAPVHFSATVAGAQDTGVLWSSDCCELRDGSFTAPQEEGTVHVVAHSAADASQMAIAVVTVTSSSPIDPSAVTLAAGDRITFSAGGDAAWAVAEGLDGGSITAAGVYQAPPDHGGIFHVVAEGIGSAVVTVVPPDLIDSGGPVIASTRTFALWWGDPVGWPADVRSTQEALLRGLDGSRYLALADQYLRGATASTRFGGSFSDWSAPPATPDMADAHSIGVEACHVLSAGGVTPAAGDMVFVYSSTAMTPAPAYCAWHSYFDCQGVSLLVAFVPNVAGSWSCLKLGSQDECNGESADANATASLTAHELLEAMTDPFVSSWMDRAGDELGDKCEDRSSCIALSSGAFQLQSEYSNADHACAP